MSWIDDLLAEKEKNLKPFSDINQSDTAKRKLKNIAKNNQLPLEFVSTLYKFYWDLDPVSPNESIGWVKKTQFTQEQFLDGVQTICDFLNIDKKIIAISKEAVISRLINELKQNNKADIENKLLMAGEQANHALLSEFATVHYYHNYTKDKLIKLCEQNNQDKYTEDEFMWSLFLKVFRAGSLEKASIFYAYTDLFFKLPYQINAADSTDWLKPLITDIENLKKSTLTDLVKCCKGKIKGNKLFKQAVLESLAFSGYLKVNNISTSDIFLPFYKDELASHFYANEWQYPLRMWNE